MPSFLMWSQRVYPAVLLRKHISADINILLSVLLTVYASLPQDSTSLASVLQMQILVCLETSNGLKICFIIPNTLTKFAAFILKSFSHSEDMLYPK
jgi:hypothetical protein